MQLFSSFFPHRAYLEYMHFRCLRRILGIKAAFYRIVSDADVLRRAGAECLEAYVRGKQLVLLSYILRREQAHPDRLVCFEPNIDSQLRMPAGTGCRRGRPRLTCAASISPCFRGFLPELKMPQSKPQTDLVGFSSPSAYVSFYNR